MPQDQPYLSVVIPAYREAAAIRAGKLQAVRNWIDQLEVAGELIVVDDGSDDETVALARKHADRVLEIPHEGKAAALLRGFSEARGERVLWTDMDLATPIAQGSRLLEALEAGAKMAVGSRGWNREGAPFNRLVMSRVHSILHMLLGLAGQVDTQCGFKAARREDLRRMVERLRLYRPRVRRAEERHPNVSSGFDLELLIIARELNLRVVEVPVSWVYMDTRRVLGTRDGVRGLREMLKLAWLKWSGAYSRN